MSYQIEIKKVAVKFLKQIPEKISNKILIEIDALAENPYPPGYKKLKDTDNEYRIRIGDYRVIYSIYNEKLIIEIIKIAHRKDVYK
jgi:mRNA interferase RelE/StbE